MLILKPIKACPEESSIAEGNPVLKNHPALKGRETDECRRCIWVFRVLH
jgi:hypothetical protein